jgi:hypothetical protein
MNAPLHYQPLPGHGKTWKFTTPTGEVTEIISLDHALALAETNYQQDRQEALTGTGPIADVLRSYFSPRVPEPKPLKHSLRDILNLMLARGGFFVQKLASATAAADPQNQHKMLAAFPELFGKYEEQLSCMIRKDFSAAPGMSSRVETQTMVQSGTGKKWNAAGNISNSQPR